MTLGHVVTSAALIGGFAFAIGLDIWLRKSLFGETVWYVTLVHHLWQKLS